MVEGEPMEDEQELDIDLDLPAHVLEDVVDLVRSVRRDDGRDATHLRPILPSYRSEHRGDPVRVCVGVEDRPVHPKPLAVTKLRLCDARDDLTA
jgi:hypothetical protein